jgi:hypothetical protein
MKNAFGYINLLTALTISAIAIYYSVAGLAAIFAAAVIPIIVMGVALELGKLVTAVWLHRYWSRAVWWLRTYLALAVFVLMFITSMGIFGFLSKAHIEQTSLSQEQVALIDTLNDKENRSTAKIDRWRGELDRLVKGEDVRVDGLIDKEQEGLDKIYARIKSEKDGLRADANAKIEQQQTRIKQAQDRRDAEIKAAEKKFEGSIGGTKAYEDAVKKAKDNELGVASRAQAEILKINTQLDTDLKAIDAKYAKDVADINKRINGLRNEASNKTQDIEGRIKELEGWIEGEQKIIDEVREEKFGYEKQYRKLEAEVGPIKYIAEFIYGEQADQNLLEAAVRWVIIIIIFVFDPLAVLLLIASQYTFRWSEEDKGGRLPPKPEPDPQPEDPEPPFSEEDWEEAHRENEAWDQAQYKELKAEPAISKKKTNQYLLWEDIDPDVDKESDDELVYKKEADEKRTTLGTAQSTEEVDPNQLAFDFDKEPEEVPGDDLEKWNEWVEAANKAAAENPEDDEEDDDEFWNNVTDEEREAMRLWKAENPNNHLKLQRRLFKKGVIEEYPWTKYLKAEPDFVEDKFQIMPELEEDLKKKKYNLNWMEKEGNQQIKKSKEIEE